MERGTPVPMVLQCMGASQTADFRGHANFFLTPNHGRNFIPRLSFFFFFFPLKQQKRKPTSPPTFLPEAQNPYGEFLNSTP